MCGCSNPYTFVSGGCCKPRPPAGQKWDEVYTKIEPLLAEVDALADTAASCCGQPTLDSVKDKLSPDWIGKVNAILKEASMVADLHFFVTYNGQSHQSHLWLRVFELTSAGGIAITSSQETAP
jgi:hypothetical protein